MAAISKNHRATTTHRFEAPLPIDVPRPALRATIDALPVTEKNELARLLGYKSFESLLADSTVMSLADGSAWCLTTDRSGSCLAWNVYAMQAPQCIQTNQDARDAVRQQ